MNEAIIRLARESDLDQIMEIVCQAQKFIRAQGFDQWSNGYPKKEQFIVDMQKQACYVMERKDEILGFMTLLFEKEGAYDDISGRWLSDYPYGVIHRSAVKASYRGKHLIRDFFEFAQKSALERNIKSLRIDTHEQNKPMRSAVESFGFVYCGIVWYEGAQKRVAYEKIMI